MQLITLEKKIEGKQKIIFCECFWRIIYNYYIFLIIIKIYRSDKEMAFIPDIFREA